MKDQLLNAIDAAPVATGLTLAGAVVATPWIGVSAVFIVSGGLVTAALTTSALEKALLKDDEDGADHNRSSDTDTSVQRRNRDLASRKSIR